MSQYDEEDYINEDEIPEFHDEGELDDYLNDEEYDLMNQVLPEVKEGMKDYHGWTTFNLKLAILDTDFGSKEALHNLRKHYKKKKNNVDNAMGNLKISAAPTPTPSPTPASLNKTKKSVPSKSTKDDIDILSDDEDEEDASSRHWVKEEVEEKIIKAYKRAAQPTKPRNPIDVKQYIDTQAKPHLNFVVLGHVDAGKSTLMGRLLYDIGAVDKNKIRKLKKESEQIGKGSFHLAWVMDQTTEERERGVTVSICTSDFKTPAANFTIVDAPGHRDFVPNAIAGVSQADVAVLSVDCGTDAFESGFNLDGQTKEHTLLARSMDISTIVVAMNKMDTVDWSAIRFYQIQDELMEWFKKIGYKEDQIKWVPLSGFSGEGVYKIPYPEEQNWYDGPSLVETLETVATKVNVESRKEVLDKPFIFSILEVTTTKKHDESILAGKVESGSIQPGETITIYPSEQSCLVDKIIAGREQEATSIAVKGDFVTLKLRQSHAKDIEGGDLCASVGYDIKSARKFKIRLSTFQMNRPLLPGTSVMLFRGVYEQPARINKLLTIVDPQDPSKVLKKKVKHLPSNQTAVVEIELTERRRWIPMVTIDENKHIGRVIIRKDGRSVATGAILEVE
ncbi:elongation factor 1 alpha-like protein [Monosporozyma unispora]|nr:Hsp70 suppressor, GTPase facilitates ribosomal subunit dissociation [Kazachstania unispora]